MSGPTVYCFGLGCARFNVLKRILPTLSEAPLVPIPVSRGEAPGLDSVDGHTIDSAPGQAQII